MRSSVSARVLVVFALGCSGGESDGSAAMGGGGGEKQPDESVTYCDVEPVLVDKCLRCHGEPPDNGAPFSVTGYEDTQKPHGSGTIADQMAEAVQRGIMPPVNFDLDPPVEALTDDEVELIVQWVEDGAEPGDCP